MSIWAILAAPLIAGNDLRNMTQATINLLANPEITAVDQDAAGIQGYRVWQEGPEDIWKLGSRHQSTRFGLLVDCDAALNIGSSLARTGQ